MAEPAGIFMEIDLDEKSVKRLLNQKFEEAKFGKKLGYYFSELLFNSINKTASVFLFHYDKKQQKCFIAYLLNHFIANEIAHFPKILEIISRLKHKDTDDYAIVMTTFPDVLWGYKIGETVNKILAANIPQNKVEQLSERFWSFSENGNFPEAPKAFNKRNYFYKNFKNYYKKYLAYIEETLKPEKIAKATQEEPYHLLEDFYTYNNKVYHFKNFNNQIIELPHADPLTFGSRGYWADENYVFNLRLTPDSPTNRLPGGRNNPKAIWEWYIVEGIHGGSYEYIKERWDTVYFRDKDSVFYNLKKIVEADRDSFEYLDFCFGRDKNHVFYADKIIPIDTHNFVLNENGFLWDQKNIFHYNNQLPLDAQSFKVLDCKKGTYIGVGINGQPFTGTFVLEDKNGVYEYNKDWEGALIKLITSYKED